MHADSWKIDYQVLDQLKRVVVKVFDVKFKFLFQKLKHSKKDLISSFNIQMLNENNFW